MNNQQSQDLWGRVGQWVAGSYSLKIMVIGFLILVLQIPLLMITSTIDDRETNRDVAEQSVTSTYGKRQSLLGPVIEVPYKKKILTEVMGKNVPKTVISYGYFLPETLQITSEVKGEIRYRGIFEVPLYKTKLTLDGTFAAPSFEGMVEAEEDILWHQSRVLVGISDPRAINNQVVLGWQGQDHDFRPGGGTLFETGIHTPISLKEGGDVTSFRMTLNLNGSVSLMFGPFGKTTKLQMTSDWPDPSFIGKWLPQSRTIKDDGFTAAWAVPYLGRDFPQKFTQDQGVVLNQNQFGVKFLSMIDPYAMSHRSIKYQLLFLGLVFLCAFMVELLTGLKIHPIQYFLIGAALCLFYLVLLSLSEHIGFLGAYLGASFSTVALIAGYSFAVLKTGQRALTMAAVLTFLFVFLYMLLRVQDYALLFGSGGLFLALGLVMYLTRNVDWYRSS